mgnify:CR=1 FL=1
MSMEITEQAREAAIKECATELTLGDRIRAGKSFDNVPIQGHFVQLAINAACAEKDKEIERLKVELAHAVDMAAQETVLVKSQIEACHEQFKRIYETLPPKTGGYSGSECIDAYFNLAAELAELKEIAKLLWYHRCRTCTCDSTIKDDECVWCRDYKRAKAILERTK